MNPPSHASNLPNELVGEIVSYYESSDFADSDRKTLLSLALVSRMWRDECQKKLFGCMQDGPWRWHTSLEPYRRGFTEVHIGFLRAILDQPVRLGVYVRTYGQLHLAYPQNDVEDIDQIDIIGEDASPGIHLWHLTCCALPFMVNLQHLSFSLEARTAEIESYANLALKGCTFQLRTLLWLINAWEHDDGGLSHLYEFLSTQSSLESLEIGEYMVVQTADLDDFPIGICPSLTSVCCDFTSIVAVSQGRHINSWRTEASRDYYDRSERRSVPPLPNAPTMLRSLRNLSLDDSDFEDFLSYIDHTNLRVELLEISCGWHYETVTALSNFPKLRVLVLDGFGEVDKFGKGPDPWTGYHGLATRALRQCPELEYIYAGITGLEFALPSIFLRLSIASKGGETLIQIDHVDIDQSPHEVWWHKYYSVVPYVPEDDESESSLTHPYMPLL